MPAQAPRRPPAHPPLPQGSPLEPTPAHSPVLGVGTLNVLALLEVGLPVPLEKGWAVRGVGAPHRPVVTAALVVPGRGKTRNRLSPQSHHFLAPLIGGELGAQGSTYFRALSLMVKGHPRGSTSKTVGFPTPAARQPCLQWMESSPICSATAMLVTTTVSLALSTGHFSGGEGMLTPWPAQPAPPLAALPPGKWPGTCSSRWWAEPLSGP